MWIYIRNNTEVLNTTKKVTNNVVMPEIVNLIEQRREFKRKTEIPQN